MADRLEKAKSKHHPEPEQNVQKQNEHQEQAIDEVKTITNIYYDCLERIFDFLDLESLLNVAGTCKRLQIAAAAKFGDDYGKNYVNFKQSKFGTRNYHIAPGIYSTHHCHLNFITVVSSKFCFPFLRCFGAKMSSLDVDYNGIPDSQISNLDRYINQYCAGSLTRFCILNKPMFAVENFPKPFTCITEMGIMNSNFKNNLPKLPNLFPILCDLDVEDVTIDENSIAVHFPHLKEFTVDIKDKYTKNGFTIKNIKNLLNANRQLKKFSICSEGEIKLNDLLNMISENKSILTLTLDSKFTKVTATELNRLIQEHPLVEELDFTVYRCMSDAMIMFTHQMTSLKSLYVTIIGPSERDRFLKQLDKKWKHEIVDDFGQLNDYCIALKNLD